MNPYLDDELEALQDSVQRFAMQRIAPGSRARERECRIDRELMRAMGALGLIAPELPAALGGLGMNTLASGVIVESVARADFSMAYVQLLASLIGQILAEHAQPQLARPWLERVVAGEALLAIALTEPHAGSDAANLRLKMRRDGDQYVLDGEKASISVADQADAAVVFARTGSVEDGAQGVSAIFVPLDLPGITRSRLDCHGQRAIGRGSLFFDAARVPADNLLGREGGGFVQVMKGFDFSRALIGLQCIGAAQQSLDETWHWVTQRRAFGQPIAAFQGVSHTLAEFDTQLQAARLLCLQTLWLKQRGAPHTAEAAMCKWWAPKLAYDTIHACLLMHGHGGYGTELPFEQRLRDVLGLQIGDGTAQIMKTVIARQRAGRRAVPA